MRKPVKPSAQAAPLKPRLSGAPDKALDRKADQVVARISTRKIPR